MSNAGKTYALCGQNFSKDDNIIHFVGEVDELNSHLGLIKAMLSGSADNLQKRDISFTTSQFIENIQKKLMKLMSHASDIKNSDYFFSENETADLEKEIDKLTDNLPKLTNFVLPGKSVIEAHIQIARAVARRAERCFFSVKGQLCPHAGEYLNKLSGYLFILSQKEY